jgi:hypothetical protein
MWGEPFMCQLASLGSTKIAVGYRGGSFAESGSSRTNCTDVGSAASAFFDMKTRPALVAAHSVEVSLLPRSTRTCRPCDRRRNRFRQATGTPGRQRPEVVAQVDPWLRSCFTDVAVADPDVAVLENFLPGKWG